jgi:hypothetical protein
MLQSRIVIKVACEPSRWYRGTVEIVPKYSQFFA